MILIIVLITAGCINTDDNNGDDSIHPTYDVIKIGMNEYVNSSNEFTFEMYKQLDDSEDNIFFSPYSISIALGMAYEGARGETATEMEQVLDLADWSILSACFSLVSFANT